METLNKSFVVVPAPDRVEGRLQREPRVVKHFWIPACAGMTLLIGQRFPYVRADGCVPRRGSRGKLSYA
jgi:hypothetical protein